MTGIPERPRRRMVPASRDDSGQLALLVIGTLVGTVAARLACRVRATG